MLGRRRRTVAKGAAGPVEASVVQAHIVWPASKLEVAKRGEAVEARCGATVTGDPPTEDAPICQACVVAQLNIDDKASGEQATKRFEAGVADGRRQLERQMQSLAADKARRERAELEAPRFELLDDDRAIRFFFQDGTTATVRRDHVGSVLLDTQDGVHRVVVDGYVLVSHADPEVVRRHHDRVHALVFGSRVATQAS